MQCAATSRSDSRPNLDERHEWMCVVVTVAACVVSYWVCCTAPFTFSLYAVHGCCHLQSHEFRTFFLSCDSVAALSKFSTHVTAMGATRLRHALVLLPNSTGFPVRMARQKRTHRDLNTASWFMIFCTVIEATVYRRIQQWSATTMTTAQYFSIDNS